MINSNEWHPQTSEVGPTSPNGQVRQSDPLEAQEYCNFPLLVPQELPADTSITASILRPECPPGRDGGSVKTRSLWTKANPCSFMFEIEGSDRKLRLKEFLYDWAPAAADQPCLWGKPTHAEQIHTDYVVWHGQDYKGNPGAYARIFRTSCEVSVLSGTFSDAEIAAIYRSLEPASTTYLELIGKQSFAHLSYWSRFSCHLVDPPHGLFRFRRPEDETYSWTDDLNVVNDWAMPVFDESTMPGFRFDSAGLFGSSTSASTSTSDETKELETIYTSGDYQGREIRLITQRGKKGRIKTPAQLEDHPCTVDEVEINQVSVQRANVDPNFGPFEAVWYDQNSDISVLCMTSAGTRMTHEWFDGILGTMVTS